MTGKAGAAGGTPGDNARPDGAGDGLTNLPEPGTPPSLIWSSRTDEIAKTKALVDDGAITLEEFNQLKSVALGRQAPAGAEAGPIQPTA